MRITNFLFCATAFSAATISHAQDMNSLMRGMQGQNESEAQIRAPALPMPGAMRPGMPQEAMPADMPDLDQMFQSIAQPRRGATLQSGQAPSDAQGMVIFYRTAGCGYCKQAASYMQQKGIAYSERDVNNNTYQNEYRKVGGKGVPTFVFGQKTLLGFSQASFDSAYAEFKRSAQR